MDMCDGVHSLHSIVGSLMVSERQYMTIFLVPSVSGYRQQHPTAPPHRSFQFSCDTKSYNIPTTLINAYAAVQLTGSSAAGVHALEKWSEYYSDSRVLMNSYEASNAETIFSIPSSQSKSFPRTQIRAEQVCKRNGHSSDDGKFGLNFMLDYLNLHYDIFGLLHDIPASCCLSFLISFISSET